MTQAMLFDCPVELRAISLTQPWASLVAIGAKNYETRSWSTPYRGLLAIAAAKGFPRACKELCEKTPFVGTLRAADVHWPDILAARGHIIAVAELVGCQRTLGWPPFNISSVVPAANERDFGDYTPGRFAWGLANVRRLEQPVPAKGALGLWTVPDDVARAVQEQIR